MATSIFSPIATGMKKKNNSRNFLKIEEDVLLGYEYPGLGEVDEIRFVFDE